MSGLGIAVRVFSPGTGEARRENGGFEARLDYMVSLRLVWAVNKTASKQEMISL